MAESVQKNNVWPTFNTGQHQIGMANGKDQPDTAMGKAERLDARRYACPRQRKFFCHESNLGVAHEVVLPTWLQALGGAYKVVSIHWVCLH